jgi:hypothetical protein
MAHYTLTSFVRQASNTLLAEYFVAKGIALGIDPKTLKPRNIAPIVEAIDLLPEAERDAINLDFRRITDLGDEVGTRQIIHEGAMRGRDLTVDLAAQNSFHNKSFWTFLNASDVFQGASQIAVPFARGRYWKRGFPVPAAPVGDLGAKVGELEQAISAFFRHEEGRGNACKVEYVSRGPLHHFHAYPEDFPMAPLAWSGHTLAPHPYRPAFEVVFAYRADEETLDIWFEGGKAIVERLWAVFAAIVLGLSEVPKVDKPSYRLEPLKARHFLFVRPPDSPIVEVRVKRLGLAVFGARPATLTVEADVTDDPDALYLAMDSLIKVPLTLTKVIGATLRATIDPRDGGKNRVRSFDLSLRSCSLKHEGADLLMRQMLRDSGIDQTGKLTEASDGAPRQVA